MENERVLIFRRCGWEVDRGSGGFAGFLGIGFAQAFRGGTGINSRPGISVRVRGRSAGAATCQRQAQANEQTGNRTGAGHYLGHGLPHRLNRRRSQGKQTYGSRVSRGTGPESTGRLHDLSVTPVTDGEQYAPRNPSANQFDQMHRDGISQGLQMIAPFEQADELPLTMRVGQLAHELRKRAVVFGLQIQ